MSEGYNGYKNWETHTIAARIDNNEDLYKQWAGRAEELLEEHEDDKEKATEELAAELEQSFEEILEEISDNAFYDFAQHAFNQVDWEEIAATKFDD